MYLVTQSKHGRVNQLGYSPRTKEYVYFHRGVEIWREKGDDSLLTYFNAVRAGVDFSDVDIMEMPTYDIWNKYCDSCQEFEKKEWQEPTRKIVGII